MKKITFIILALVSICACTKEGRIDSPSVDKALIANGHEIICTTPGEVRAQLGAAENGKYPVVWDTDDSIKVYGASAQSGVVYTNTSNDATVKSATFYTPDEPVTDATRYAVYPAAKAGTLADNKISVDFGGLAVQGWHSTIANYGNFDDGSVFDYTPMFASSSNETFTFKNLCGAITLRLNDYMGQEIYVDHVKLTTDKIVWGVAKIDLDGNIVSWEGNDEQKSIVMGTSVDGDGAKLSPSNYATNTCNLNNRFTRFTFFLPVGTYNSFDFEIVLRDGRIFRQSSTNTVTVEAGIMKPYPTLQFSLWYGKTNCYVTTPGTDVEIDITPYYNLRTLAVNDSNRKVVEGTLPTLTPCLLWEMHARQSSTGPSQDPSATTLVLSGPPTINGNTMTVPIYTNRGNAVVGLKDASGKVVWSYHIWVTQQIPADQDYSVGGDNFKLMDRDLGAAQTFTFDTKSAANAFLCYGMFYQWGRKEPLPVIGTTTYSTASTCWFSSAEPGNYTTIMDMLNNPLTTYSVNSASTPSILYGYAENRQLWGSTMDYSVSALANIGTKGANYVKTIYDPCPEGYMVPQYYHFTALGLNDYYNDAEKQHSIRNGYVAWLKTGVDGVEACYPLQGYLTPSANSAVSTYTAGTTKLTNNGTYSEWWTSNPYGSGTWAASYLMIRSVKDEGDPSTLVHIGPYNNNQANRIHGYAGVHSVRCLKQE